MKSFCFMDLIFPRIKIIAGDEAVGPREIFLREGSKFATENGIVCRLPDGREKVLFASELKPLFDGHDYGRIDALAHELGAFC